MVACAGDALAAEGHGPRWADFGWRVANFIIFAGILWYFVGGLAKKFFKGRRQSIKDELEGLEARREAAKESLASVEARIANLEAERKAILDESREQAARLHDSIVEDARRQADQILEQARLTAENEGRAVLNEVRATLADEIVAATEKALQAKLNASAHEQLITQSLNKVVLH
ncbi:MAG: ATP synthase F0 subunit B [Desulfovibrio sp.]|nr:ATP synthase F0 subunit B [Desulfovibrio sp.]